MCIALYLKQTDGSDGPTRTSASRLVRSYVKTILSNPESRKIFYFLVLNMCYMLVQMLYGVWTNSLGLISDAIHMAFDCMAIGVGLLASVMATWEPNERFTYGYGRIETLSGFANGIFLILISIFIVFEAIGRLIEPPEMNTSQLLLGHSHGHDHGHDHSHDEQSHEHAHSHDRGHDHNDAHSHTHHDGHQHTHASTHEGHSHNMRGVFLHVMADTLGSVGVIISTILIQLYGWTGFDPIASLFIAVMIAASVIALVIDTGKVLCLDVADRSTAIQEALDELSLIEGLASYSAPRFWPKDSTSIIGSIHIQLLPSAASYDPAGPHGVQRVTYAQVDRVVLRVKEFLTLRIPGLEELTIQVEESHPSSH
ncbi:cation efflux protein [Fistulina hepatica ATCC 64428]|uniref:Cation efflux protein n=1 Tax=Fistulina hepatica ATCC 64428 TaxID=1128425 RepID=A0A0D7AM74_9AGAR|nr:cation efflux protein [Fistulina hepatica ATCC 64428]